MIITKPT